MSRLAQGEFFGVVRNRVAAQNATLSRLEHTSARKLPLHTHNAPYYAMLLRGHYRESSRRGEIDYRPLTMVFHPAETSHTDEIGPRGGLFFTIELDEGFLGELAAAGGSATPPVSLQDPASSWAALRLYRQSLAGSLTTLSLQESLVEIVTRTLGTCLVKETMAPQWLARVIEVIQARFTERITLEELSREADVHPVHLSRVFKARMGTSMTSYVHRLRVEYVARLMAERQCDSLAEIAQRSGFADQSHLCRVFKRITGSTPREINETLR
jgi:AraC family transcriptional regulator